MIIVQVGSADSSGTEPHQYLAILRARLWAILNFELFGSVNDTSDHTGEGFGVLEGGQRGCGLLEPVYSVLGVSLGVSRSMTQVLDILLRHLVSDIIRLPNCERYNRQCRICRRAGCELAAV